MLHIRRVNGPSPADDPETYAIIGAGMAVHVELGCGFLEGVYTAALEVEFARRGIPFRREVLLPITYRNVVLPVRYRVDFICWDAVLVEVKAATALSPIDQAQVINYLKAARLSRALLINFGAQSLQHRRLVWTQPPPGLEGRFSP